MIINKDLIKYIEENIFPSYEKNDEGHNLDHIKYVIDRSMKFASLTSEINYDMVYTIASYHDIGHYIDAKNHEKISGEMLLNDVNLKDYFDEEQIKIMSEAVQDHRASSYVIPRSIYGKIVSSADRNTSIDSILKRSYVYAVKHNPIFSIDEIISKCKKHITDKFGNNGYAAEKMYFKDDDYEQFLINVENLVKDDSKFREKFIKVNNL